MYGLYHTQKNEFEIVPIEIIHVKKKFNMDCCFCLENLIPHKIIILNCSHAFHLHCFVNYAKHEYIMYKKKNIDCPCCKKCNIIICELLTNYSKMLQKIINDNSKISCYYNMCKKMKEFFLI